VDAKGSHINSDDGSLFGSSGDNKVSDQKEVVTAELTKLSLKSPSDDDNRSDEGDDKKSDASMLNDEGSRFLAESAARYLEKSAESSDENELTEFNVVGRGEKKQEYHLSSSSWKRNLPLQTSTRVLEKKCDPQVLYHGVFTMLIHQLFLNIRPNPIPSIEDIVSSRKMKIVPTNAKFNALVIGWNIKKKLLHLIYQQ
jgi:hypothetical protein